MLQRSGAKLCFLRKKNKRALEAFKNSLGQFENEPENKEITKTHILHLALAMKDAKLFESCARSFFHYPIVNDKKCINEIISNLNMFSAVGDSNEDSPLKQVLHHCWQNTMESNYPYKLLIFIKAINLMGLWRDKKILNIILNTDYPAYFTSMGSHPWELIYRHIAEIAFKAGLLSEGEYLVRKSVEIGTPVPQLTLQVLHLGTRMMAASYLYQGRKLEQYYNETIEELKEICFNSTNSRYIYSDDNPDSWFYDCVTTVDYCCSSDKKAQKFLNYFTYAYR